MRTNNRPQSRPWMFAAILGLSTLAFSMPVQAQESSTEPKRDPQPERDAARPRQERRTEERRRQPGEGEVRTVPAGDREMAPMEERLRQLDRRLDELNQRLDRLVGPAGQARRFRQGQVARPGDFRPGSGRLMSPGGGQGPTPQEQPQQPQPPGMPGENPGEMRLNHVQAAIDNLHAAGMHEPAERLAQELRRLRNERGGEPGNSFQPRGPAGPGMEQLRAELQELRRANEDLRRKLEERDRR